ncbi:MAG: N4-gp56 family major capsid protein [Clostridiales bacterium]|nr:N4-gp56 family major capsid protein [Clostridiales bacterium]
MAVNYAVKYASKIDERFASEALTDRAVNKDYDFVGVKTVNVYSIPTSPMNDYTREGAERYGTPQELQNTVQEMTVTKDRSFTFSIDRGNFDDTQMTSAAGAALQRQIREVIIPEIDAYRLKKMYESASKEVRAVDSSSAYDAFLDGTAALMDARVPVSDCIAFISSTFYKSIKSDPSFIKNGDLSQKMLIKGQVGMIDGIAVVAVPADLLPSPSMNFMIAYKNATVAPVKLSEYKIHDNPPGINGWLVEGRVYYDAFVLSNKAAGLYASCSE